MMEEASSPIFLRQRKEKTFELIFGTPTGLNFEHTAMMYNGQYTKVLDLEDLSVSVGEATSMKA